MKVNFHVISRKNPEGIPEETLAGILQEYVWGKPVIISAATLEDILTLINGGIRKITLGTPEGAPL